MTAKLNFAGHDTFYCRSLWLQKGLEIIQNGGKLNDDATVTLGVGKNMVSAIKFWLKAFDIINELGEPTPFAKLFLDEAEGLDPYGEDIATLWMLHYKLVTTEKASIYHLAFTYFRKQRIEFQREHLTDFIDRKAKELSSTWTRSTLERDVLVFINNYVAPVKHTNIEDELQGLLHDLELVKPLREQSGSWYKIEPDERESLPWQVALYCIMEENKGQTVAFDDLLNSSNQIGTVFALTSNGLMRLITEMQEQTKNLVVFKDDGGVRTLQFSDKLDTEAYLRKYYKN